MRRKRLGIRGLMIVVALIAAALGGYSEFRRIQKRWAKFSMTANTRVEEAEYYRRLGVRFGELANVETDRARNPDPGEGPQQIAEHETRARTLIRASAEAKSEAVRLDRQSAEFLARW